MPPSSAVVGGTDAGLTRTLLGNFRREGSFLFLHPFQALPIKCFLSHSMSIPFDLQLLFVGHLVPGKFFPHEFEIVPFFHIHAQSSIPV
eukprot:scaffold8973_cov78-Cylindrotheca_fusiformis.AAC.4